MGFDDLPNVWRAQAPAAPPPPLHERIAAVRARASALERLVRLRDRTETVVALLMLPLFGWLAFRVPSPVSKVGAMLVAASCVVIPLRLRGARQATRDAGAPVLTALRAERQRLQAQLQLMRSAGWWYVAPLVVGVTCFLAGARTSLAARLAMIAVGFLVGLVLLIANRRAAERELAPVVARLDEALYELQHADAEVRDAR